MKIPRSRNITKQQIGLLTRKVLYIDIPTGYGYNNFESYEMRRHNMDDSGLLLKLNTETDEYDIVKSYSRDNEWEVIKELVSKVFCNLGVRTPDFMWAKEKDQYFNEKVGMTDKDVLITLKDKLTDEVDLGSLFG